MDLSAFKCLHANICWCALQGVVKKVEADKLTLTDGTELRFGLCIWSTGVGPTPFITSLPCECYCFASCSCIARCMHSSLHVMVACASVQPSRAERQVAKLRMRARVFDDALYCCIACDAVGKTPVGRLAVDGYQRVLAAEETVRSANGKEDQAGTEATQVPQSSCCSWLCYVYSVNGQLGDALQARVLEKSKDVTSNNQNMHAYAVLQVNGLLSMAV